MNPRKFFPLILLIAVLAAIFYFLARPVYPALFVFFNHKQNIESELPERLQEIDRLMPIWLYVKNSSGEIAFHDIKKQERIEAIVKNAQHPVKIIPVINNHDGIDWQKTIIEELFGDINKQNTLISHLINYLKDNHYKMLNVDFEAFSEEYLDDYADFLIRAAMKFHQENLEISVCISPYWAPQLKKELAEKVDQIVIMLYDEHWVTSSPGPISSQAWFEKTFKQFYEMYPRHKIIAAMGNYAYDWPRYQQAKDMSVLEAMNLAKKFDATIIVDPDSQNPMFHYIDRAGVPHQVWFLNAETFRLQMDFLKNFSIGGAALWQMGSEDPQIWSILKEL